ncbi:hypothetical protein [Clostridium sp. ZS2-4]|uniref:hypothetical protein n=1 Tax=Clostridium sp. ZS2-4 TaxID=2987703 RepID=UPI00227BA409|nr:hypothetical protein [Clostridium sp. ZS2-4]MCY6356066.1 hypothetical protein [Clostridium sp. ZS2-4]
MLENNDKQKLEQYIDKVIKGIQTDANNSKADMSDKQLIDKVINVTVNKFTPESKMILSSTYNMLMEHTLSSTKYADAEKKATFYEMDILKALNGKFSFEVPKDIDYRESRKEINKWVKSGAVVIVGGVISISLESWIPVGIAVVIAGIMALLLKDGSKGIDAVINEYLMNVKQSVLLWIDSIEKYYDDRVAQLEREMID